MPAQSQPMENGPDRRRMELAGLRRAQQRPLPPPQRELTDSWLKPPSEPNQHPPRLSPSSCQGLEPVFSRREIKPGVLPPAPFLMEAKQEAAGKGSGLSSCLQEVLSMPAEPRSCQKQQSLGARAQASWPHWQARDVCPAPSASPAVNCKVLPFLDPARDTAGPLHG